MNVKICQNCGKKIYKDPKLSYNMFALTYNKTSQPRKGEPSLDYVYVKCWSKTFYLIIFVLHVIIIIQTNLIKKK